MKLLLDTHIWIWSVGEREKLKRSVLAALEDPANEKWLSPISVWELTVLVRKGRVTLNTSVQDWVEQAMKTAPLREAPLTNEVALAVESVHLLHRDPADAFLAATAKVFDLTLVTADAHLRAAKGISFL